jgi:hypothetical protein
MFVMSLSSRLRIFPPSGFWLNSALVFSLSRCSMQPPSLLFKAMEVPELVGNEPSRMQKT